MNSEIVTSIKKIVISRITIVFSVAIALLASASVATAYGPQRPTYTIQNAAPHITFNSITNNSSYGDERDFMNIKPTSNTSSGGWQNNLEVQDGKEYWVRVFVHNNAKADLNLTATNTRIAVSVPSEYGKSVQLDGFISADNATPQEIWDDAVMTSDKRFNVSYVQGSARYYNNVNNTSGFTLSDNIVTNTGALVGYQSMNGQLPGCNQYSGYAVFKVKVSMSSPDFIVEKSVRPHGSNKWHDSITAKPGQKVDYQIYYDNTGNSNQLDVVAIDQLPSGVSMVNGSTNIKNGSYPQGKSVSSNNIVSNSGVNIGSYSPGGNAYVWFTATLPKASKLECGLNTLVNTGTISTQNGEKDDTATVKINKECAGVEALPQTGPLEVIAGLVGVSAITFGVVYYLKSRRDLDTAVMDAHKHSKTLIDPPHIRHHDDED